MCEPNTNTETTHGCADKIENGLYFLKDDPVKRGVLRHDLLRLDDSQTIPEEVKQSNIDKIAKAEPKPTKRLSTKTRSFMVV